MDPNTLMRWSWQPCRTTHPDSARLGELRDITGTALPAGSKCTGGLPGLVCQAWSTYPQPQLVRLSSIVRRLSSLVTADAERRQGMAIIDRKVLIAYC